ncbi:MAG TPA: N-6 DNA methylase [Capsulimonadaceae bacterium]
MTVRTEGAILPPDLLRRIADLDKTLDGLTADAYHLSGEKLNEATSQAWSRAQSAWNAFQQERVKLETGAPGTTTTREKWLLPLFKELGYGRLATAKAIECGERSYAISHLWGHVPIHIVGFAVDLDKRTPGAKGASVMSPHGLVQDLLNVSDDYLWAFVSNGLKLRVLRDNSSLTRQAFVEFDLEEIMSGAVYSDFVLLWLVCHQSSVDADRPADFRVEKWSHAAQDQGLRALESLRGGVKDAIEAIGQGFLRHRVNSDLRDRVHDGTLNAQEFYRQVLRIVYRLLFLLIAEDRDLLLLPDAASSARHRYMRYYAVARLRRLAGRSTPAGRHDDLYRALCLVFEKLGSDDGCDALGLPALGGFLFSNAATASLAGCQIENGDLLRAVRALAYTADKSGRRLVDYKNLGTEELGSVYESLLELHPDISVDAGTFTLLTTAGNERKTTGSYYTPSSLVSCLLDSALDPVLDEASRKPNAEEAVLALKVCDPACGSGHFLIAGAHRIARRLAILRTSEDEPSPGAVRDCLHSVIERCLYGVDINPMSVELCKFALWLEAMVPGKALSFLDHHIQCGNSLLGTTPALMAKGIPDDAFSVIEGDDKEYCSTYRKLNKKERADRESGQLGFEFGWRDILTAITGLVNKIERAGDGTVTGERRKEQMHQELRGNSQYVDSTFLADAWCAAFVWKKRKDPTGNLLFPITDQVYRELEQHPRRYGDWLAPEVARLREQYQFFHWHLAFPTVFRVPGKDQAPENEQCGWNGGFDVVLGNPPWERIKIQEKEWFASRSPEVANAANAAKRRELIEGLVVGDPSLYDQFIEDKRKAEGESGYARHSGNFPLAGRGDINTYMIFAERCLQGISATGRYGLVLPTSIATSDSCKFYFQHLVESGRLSKFIGFDNENKTIFPSVDNNVTFAAVTVAGCRVIAPDVCFNIRDFSEITDAWRYFTLSLADIVEFNPNSQTCPVFRNSRDASIVRQVYTNLPIIDRDEPAINPWGISFLRMFDMAADSDKFLTSSDLTAMGAHREGNEYKHHEVFKPLIEAKMIWHFDHRWAAYYEFGVPLGRPSRKYEGWYGVNYADPCDLVAGRYWVAKSDIDARLPDNGEFLVAFRDITNRDLERTAAFAILPRVAVGHQAPLVIFNCKALMKGMFVAERNSIASDYVTRNKIDGSHLTYFVLKQLPTLPPDTYKESCAWAPCLLGLWLAPQVLELSYTAQDLAPFARDCGYDGEPFVWDDERRFQLRCELDAAYFHVYGIERDDVDYIMETFPIVKRKDVDKCGVYRTKDTILEMYDAMADAIRTGVPYLTRLNPPPANGWVPPAELLAETAQATDVGVGVSPSEASELVLVSPDPDVRQPRLEMGIRARTYAPQRVPWPGRERFIYDAIPHLVWLDPEKDIEHYVLSASLASRPTFLRGILNDYKLDQPLRKLAALSPQPNSFDDAYNVRTRKIRKTLENNSLIRITADRVLVGSAYPEADLTTYNRQLFEVALVASEALLKAHGLAQPKSNALVASLQLDELEVLNRG